MSKSHFYTWLFLLLPLLYYLSLPITVGDLAGWTAYGNYFWQTGRLMTADIYSVLETRPLVYPALLPLVYGLLDALGGLVLVSLLHKAALLVLLAIIYKKSLSKFENPWSLYNLPWVVLALNGISIFFIDRPALVALIPLLLAFYEIEGEKEFRKEFFIRMAVIMVVWVNIHGSWPLLLIMLGWKFLFITNSRNLLRHFTLFSGLALASLVNPFGVHIWPYIFETGTISKARLINEWNVTNFHEFFPQGILFYISAIAFLIFLARKKRRDVLASPLFPMLALGFAAFRNVGLFGLVLLPFLSHYNLLAESRSGPGPARRLNVVFVAGVMLICLMFTPYFKERIARHLPDQKAVVFDEFYQADFAAYIRESGLIGPILNDWDYGSYLLYNLPNKILIDARNVIYHEIDFQRYLAIMDGDDSWNEYAREYNFDFIMVPTKRRHVLIEKIRRSTEWKIVKQSSETTLFQKETPSRP